MKDLTGRVQFPLGVGAEFALRKWPCSWQLSEALRGVSHAGREDVGQRRQPGGRPGLEKALGV